MIARSLYLHKQVFSCKLDLQQNLRSVVNTVENFMNNKSIEIPFRKRHNYAYGMVLGVEDFQQEFAYLQNRMKFLCRMLIGRGTVSGLQVSSDEQGESILVNAGVAIDSQGNEICLSADVCCPLPSEGDTAYLTLYWAERETDFVPLPGSQEE